MKVWFRKTVGINRETKILELYAKICRFAKRIFVAGNFQWPLRLKVQNCLLHNVFGLRSEKIKIGKKLLILNLKTFRGFQVKIQNINKRIILSSEAENMFLLFIMFMKV